MKPLTGKALVMTAADDKFCVTFFHFHKKIRLDISCEPCASLCYLKPSSYSISKSKRQNLKMLPAANFGWRFKGLS